jgi:hypothetical protein
MPDCFKSNTIASAEMGVSNVIIMLLMNKLELFIEVRCRKYHYNLSADNSLTVFTAHVDDQSEGVPHTDRSSNPCT